MSKFSTFSIYEKEMRDFIQKVSEQYTVEGNDLKLELTNWIYEKGIEIFKTSQQEIYRPYMQEYKEKFGHLPLISLCHSQGQHLNGLTAVKEAMFRDCCSDNPPLKQCIERNFNNILLPAITAHERFIKIESEIASEFNAFRDKDGANLSQVEALEKVIGLFEAKQSMNPELQEDFNNKLTLMREVLAELTKAELTKKESSNSSNKFFQPKEASSLPNKETASFAPSSPVRT